MRKRLKTAIGAAAALVALVLGGSAIASATQARHGTGAQHHAARVVAKSTETTGGADKDQVQSGDQSAPDVKGTSATSSASPGIESSSEIAPESTSESSSPSDGPGGHEDPAGDVNNESEAQE
jgi:hypothetical protein